MPGPESLHEFSVSTRRGHALVIACLLLVAGGVTIFMGAPPAIEPWGWPMIGVGAVALVAAFAVHRTRRRVLRIVRDGDTHRLIVERERIRLEFPLGISGDQMEN